MSELILDGAYKTIDLTCFSFDRVIQNKPIFETNCVWFFMMEKWNVYCYKYFKQWNSEFCNDLDNSLSTDNLLSNKNKLLLRFGIIMSFEIEHIITYWDILLHARQAEVRHIILVSPSNSSKGLQVGFEVAYNLLLNFCFPKKLSMSSPVVSSWMGMCKF